MQTVQQMAAELEHTCDPEIHRELSEIIEKCKTDSNAAVDIIALYERVFGPEPEPTEEEILEAEAHDRKRLGMEFD